MNTNSLYPVASSAHLVIQELGNETLIYNTSTNQASCLNETAAFIWRSCSGERSIDEIALSFEEKFGQAVTADFVRLAISQLNDKDLLSEAGGLDIKISGRREAIRRIALTTAVAIPVVASLVAPRNVMAQTSCRCVNPGQCITQTACPSQTNCNPSSLCSP